MSQFIKFYFTSPMLNMFRTLILNKMAYNRRLSAILFSWKRIHDQCGDTIEKSQAPDDGCIKVRNMLNIEEVK